VIWFKVLTIYSRKNVITGCTESWFTEIRPNSLMWRFCVACGCFA